MTIKTIYIDILGGCCQAVYGDKLNEEVQFVLRDWDNIGAGDEDPVAEGYEPEKVYR